MWHRISQSVALHQQTLRLLLRPGRKQTSGHEDDQRHSGETLVENTSNACAEHAEYCAVVTGAAGALGIHR